MKKIFVVLLVLVMALMLLPALAAGAEEYDDYKIDSVLWPEDVPYSGQLVPANVYGHNPKYDGWEFVECIKLKAQIVGTTAATCTSTGSALCYAEAEYAGKKFQLSHKYTISALGHKGNATCTKTGICETCGQEYGPLDHDFSVDEPKKEANCTEAGYTAHKKCSICGSKDESYEVIPALGHDWGPWEVQSDGTHKRTCQRDDCGETETHAAAWGDWTKVDETSHKQTCQVDGCGISETVDHVWNGNHWCGYPRVCEYCEEYYGETLDHAFLYEYIDEDQHKAECRHCDLVVPEAHSGGKATCTEKAKCEKCEEAYGDPLDHSWSTDWSWDEDTHWHPCNNEGCNVRRDEKAHTETSEPGKTATCTEPGYTGSTRCSVCGAPMTEQTAIDPLGHQLTPVAKVEPTCTAPGTEAYWKCTRDGCGKLFSDAEGINVISAPAVIAIDKDAHPADRIADVPGKEATCTQTGLTDGKQCEDCKVFTVAQEVVPAKGHTPGDPVKEKEAAPQVGVAGSYDEVVYCTVCQAEISRETKTVDPLPEPEPEPEPEPTTYTIIVTDDGNGTAFASPASGTEGTEVTLASAPNEGYNFKDWQVISGGVTIENDKFTIGTANVEIKAIFEAEPEPEPEPEPQPQPEPEAAPARTEPASVILAYYDITVEKREGVELSTNLQKAMPNTRITVIYTLEEGRELEEISVYRYDSKTAYLVGDEASEVRVTPEFDGTYSFFMPQFDVIVKAVLKGDEEPGEEGLPFVDVTEDMDCYDDVKYLYDKGIQIGMSDTEFGPETHLTRAMLVTLLWRLEGEPAVEYDGTFSDVPAGKWYSDAVEWAASKGIVQGYGDGTFGPLNDMTREQLASILWRYAKDKDYDVSVGEDTNILSYNDAFDTPGWAMPALQWAIGAGVLEGSADGNLNGAVPATRAEIARALRVFLENVAE